MNEALLERLETVRQAIAQASREEGRAEDAVALVAVSKTHDADTILPVLELGKWCVRRGWFG